MAVRILTERIKDSENPNVKIRITDTEVLKFYLEEALRFIERGQL